MSANRKRVFKGFSYRHCDDFAAYLTDMSARGWHFKEWGAGLIFEKGEPERQEYAVEVFIHGTAYDTRPEPQTVEFAEYCQAAGWLLVDSKQKFCIFRKISPDAVPILTPEERLENTARALRSGIWLWLALCANWVILHWAGLLGPTFVSRVFSNSALIQIGLWTVLFIEAAWECIGFYAWKSRAARKLRSGAPVYFGKQKKRTSLFSSIDLWFFCGLLVALLVCYYLSGRTELVVMGLAIIGSMLLFGYLISKFRPASDTNFLLQIIFPFVIIICLGFSVVFLSGNDDVHAQEYQIPVTCEELGIDMGVLEQATAEGSESVLGSERFYWLEYEEEPVYYLVYETEHQWILDRIWKENMDARFNQDAADCTADWNAAIARRNSNGTYYVRYESAILIFDCSEDIYLTPEQIGILCQSIFVRQV